MDNPITITYTADGINRQYVIPFPFILRAYVNVYINGVITTAYTFIAPSQIQLNSVPVVGTTVTISRKTAAVPAVVFQKGTTNLSADDLNTANLQALHLAEEAGEAIAGVRGAIEEHRGRLDTDEATIEDHENRIGAVEVAVSDVLGVDVRAVHLTGAETVTGTKTFLDIITAGPVYDVRKAYAGDWKAAFESALAAVASTGGTLLIPPGDYSIPGGISYNGAHVNKPFHIIGHGAKLIGPDVAAGQTAVHVLYLQNVADVTLEGFKVGYASVTARNDNTKSISITGSKIKIRGIEVYNSMSAGIVIGGSNNSADGYYGYDIRSNTVRETLADGILVANAGGKVVISGNTIINTGDDGISVCTFKLAGSYYAKDVAITGNVVEGGSARGIYLGGTYGASVTGNTVRGKANGGIVAGYEAASDATKENYNTTISGNTISDIALSTPGEFPHGIVINHLCVGALVSGNNIHNIFGAGIMFRGAGKVTGNLIDTTTGTSGWGIYLGTYDAAYATYVPYCYGEATGNTIRNTARQAVYVARTAAEGYKIEGNTAINCVAVANYTADGSPYFQSIGVAEFLRNYLYDSRTGVTMTAMVHVDTGNFMSEGNLMYVTSGYTSGINYIGISATTTRGVRRTRILTNPVVGDNAIYGTGTDVYPIDLYVCKFQASGLAASENITVKVRALYANGATEYFEHVLADGNGAISTPTEMFTLFTSGEQPLVKWTVYAKSNQATHTGSVSVYLAGNIR